MRITVSQLRRIIKEEVENQITQAPRKAASKAVPAASYEDITNKVCELVGFGEPDDYAEVAEVIMDKLAILSTMSRSQRHDGGGLAELDPDNTEDEIFSALQSCIRSEEDLPDNFSFSDVTLDLMAAYGLDRVWDMR